MLNETINNYVLPLIPQNSFLSGIPTKYIAALVILIAFFILSKVFVFIVQKVIVKLTTRTKNKLDDVLIEQTNKPISLLLLIFGLKLAIDYVNPQGNLAYVLDKSVVTTIYIGIMYLAIVLVKAFVDHGLKTFAKKTKSSLDDALLPLIRKFASVVIVILGTIFILDTWGVDVTALIAGLGIAGLALGFAVKDSLANIFGGISLLADKTFQVGERISMQDGTVAIIEDIGIRSTKMRTFDNELLIVPNGKLANEVVKNYHHPDTRMRGTIAFGVEYGAKPDKVKKVVTSELKKIKAVLKDPAPNVVFTEMADSSLNFKAFFWVADISELYSTKEIVNDSIYAVLNKNKIGIPYPTTTVELKKKK